jgi:hypothetical protein
MSKRFTTLSAVFVSVLLTASASQGEWVFSPSSIDTERIQSGGPPKGGIPALDNPAFVGGDEADFLSGDDMILGLEIAGDSRAYPLRILSWHELVNDVVGETPVLVSW